MYRIQVRKRGTDQPVWTVEVSCVLEFVLLLGRMVRASAGTAYYVRPVRAQEGNDNG